MITIRTHRHPVAPPWVAGVIAGALFTLAGLVIALSPRPAPPVVPADITPSWPVVTQTIVPMPEDLDR